MSRSFNTLPNVRFEKVTLARSGRRTYKVRGEFEKMAFLPRDREPRPMVVPEQDVVQICKFRPNRNRNIFRLNSQEFYLNATLSYVRRSRGGPVDPQEEFFDREQCENERSRFIMAENEQAELDEIDYYGFDEFDELDFLKYSISGDDSDPLDFHSI
jgi:hypothetical protein